MKKKCIIFDFDGVIIDTEPERIIVYNEILLQYNMKFEQFEFDTIVSKGANKMFELLEEKYQSTISSEDRKIIESYTQEKMWNITKSKTKKDCIKGFPLFLQKLKSQNYIIALNSAGSISIKLLKVLKLDHYFDFLMDKSVPNYLNKANAHKIIVKSLNLTENDCIVFEDSIFGMQSSIDAGIEFISVGKHSNIKNLFHINDFSDKKLFEFFEI